VDVLDIENPGDNLLRVVLHEFRRFESDFTTDHLNQLKVSVRVVRVRVATRYAVV
jgi:hypothetical protein